MFEKTFALARHFAKTSRLAAPAALAAALLTATPVRADPIAAMQGVSVDVGHNVRGVVYYEPDDQDAYHLVVTLGAGPEATLFRFKAVLTDGQEIELSTPGRLGEPSQRLLIHREGETLNVSVPGA